MSSHDHQHRRHVRAAQNDPHPEQERAVSTVVSVIYVTESPTFTGAVGGHTTLGVVINTSSADPTTSAAAEKASTSAADTSAESAVTSSPTAAEKGSTSATTATIDANTSPESAVTSSPTTLVTATGLPTAITSAPTTLASSVGILAASGGLSSSSTAQSAASAGSGASATASASSDSSTGGMSVGGKAGLAIGILLLIGAVLSLVLFCFKKRREAAKSERIEDEKHEFSNIDRHASTGTTATSATAPRLSIRRHTQFLPIFTLKRASRGNALLTVTENGQQWDMDQPTAEQSQSNNQENPFGNHAETISPIDDTNANGPEVVRDMSVGSEVIADAAVAPAAAAAAAAAETVEDTPVLKRGASKRGNAPSPLDFTNSGPFMGSLSPAGTEFSTSSEAETAPVQTATSTAIAAAGGPANSAVHRVQLDFKPSMEDELELRAGQLVRLLHEYDDGWALCIRLDRSRQGVVPRTCLSTRPVKPRPQQNGPRGGSPGMRGPPMAPAGLAPGSPRAMTPTGSPQRPMTPNDRPMTPTGPLPSTPTGLGRALSPTIAQSSSQPNSPPGPSPMNRGASPAQFPQAPFGRKPVPGQAL